MFQIDKVAFHNNHLNFIRIQKQGTIAENCNPTIDYYLDLIEKDLHNAINEEKLNLVNIKDKILKELIWYDYENAFTELKTIKDENEKAKFIQKIIWFIEIELKYFPNNASSLNNFKKQFKDKYPKQDWNAIIKFCTECQTINSVSVYQYINKVDDELRVFPEKTNSLKDVKQRLLACLPNARKNDPRNSIAIPIKGIPDLINAARIDFYNERKSKGIEQAFKWFFTNPYFLWKRYTSNEKSILEILELPHSTLNHQYHAKKSNNGNDLSSFHIYLLHYFPAIMTLIYDIKEILDFKEIEEILTKSPLLQDDEFLNKAEKESVEIALNYGFYGNFIVTSYMIPALIEKVFTKTLQKNGFNMVKNRADATNTLEQMSNYLKDESSTMFTKLSDIFGGNLILSIKHILLDRNFRNEVYHGFESELTLISDEAKYLWYLFVRLFQKSLPT